MPADDRALTSESGDPDPAVTAGLGSPGGGVSSGDTPPNADQMSGTSADSREAPNMGPVAGNRTPMIITLVVLGIFVVMVAVIVGASFFPS